ncbi:MAG TPA: tetratricopeptide repeat protein, partial [Methylovirgula sp.]
MAWSNSPATAPVSSVPPVSDAAIDAALNEAANALRAGNADGAAARLSDLVPELVASAERCDLAGLILLGAKKPAAAFPWFDRARRLQPTSWQAQSHAGAALLAVGRLNEAANALLAAVVTGKADAVTYYHYGVVLRALGRKNEAIAALDQALRREPDYPEALRVGALILSEAGRHEQAFAFFTRALQTKPNFFEALLERANLLRLIEKHEEAYAAFTQALAHYPGNPEFLNNRGVVLIDLGEAA